MTKNEARYALATMSKDLDKQWHTSKSNGENQNYRDLIDNVIVFIDELDFQLRKKWYQK